MRLRVIQTTTLMLLLCFLGSTLGLTVASSLAFAQVQPATPTPAKAAATKPASKATTKNKTKKKRAAAAPKAPQKTPDQKTEALKDIGQKVVKISVKGNRKIESDAVTIKLVSKINEALDREHVRADLEALFKTGFFYDVQVTTAPATDGVELIYTITEKPSISEIVFSGNSAIDNDDLKEQTGVKAFEILNMTKVREGVEKMQKAYEDKGYFLARITPVIGPASPEETVKLTYQIEENEKVKVKRITFLGNKSLPDSKLKGAMQTQEGGFFSFISGSGAYKQDAFDRDVQVLSYLYFNEGYVQAKVDRPQVAVTPDKKGIYVTIRVEEGDRFKVGTVDFSGDLLFDRDDLFNSIEINKTGWYSHETLLKDLRTLQAKYGDLGYAYANPIPRTRVREKDREVDITFDIDKGNKVYFNRFNVVGNSKTRDKVVRRELTIHEGELYNETRKRESLEAVKRLGYFEQVDFNTSIPKGANDDLMDIDIVTKERNTGQIQVGAGYSTYSKVIFNGSINQINLFGRGQKLGITVELSSVQRIYNLNFTEPYFLDTKWSVGADLYRTQRQTYEYTETKTGGAIRVGHPLAPYLEGYFRYKYDVTKIDLPDPSSDYYAPELYPPESADGGTSSGTFTLEYDKRDDRFAPSKGVFGSISLEYAGLGGEKKYTKGFATARYYKPIFWGMTFRNNLTYGFIAAHDGDTLPFNELFLLGGATTLRGYDWYRVGARRFSKSIYYRRNCENQNGTYTYTGAGQTGTCASNAAGAQNIPLTPITDQKNAQAVDPNAADQGYQPYGGSQEIYYNAEIEFPLVSEAGIRGVIFYDIGESEDGLSFGDISSDYGFGFRWFSPIGPLRFEWGFPVQRRFDDKAMAFQFAIGSPF